LATGAGSAFGELPEPDILPVAYNPNTIPAPDTLPVTVEPKADDAKPAAPAPAPAAPAAAPAAKPTVPASGCGSPLQNLCAPCCTPAPTCYASVEFLLWNFTNGPRSLAGVSSGGALDFATTTEALNNNQFPGGRGTVGYWLDDDRVFGVELSGFGLQQGSAAPHGVSDNVVLFGRVLIPNFAGVENTLQTALYGGEVNALARMTDSCDSPYFNLLAGVRYLGLSDTFTASTSGNIGMVDLTSYGRSATQNNFYGGQVGFQTGLRRGRVTADFVGKLALGDMFESADVIQPTPGGVAVGAPSGHTSTSRLVVIPEGTLRVGYDVTKHFNVYMGYNYMFVSDTLRPATGTVAVPAAGFMPPAFAHAPILGSSNSNFTAQGWTAGIRFTY
jgi:hypothetical protein